MFDITSPDATSLHPGYNANYRLLYRGTDRMPGGNRYYFVQSWTLFHWLLAFASMT